MHTFASGDAGIMGTSHETLFQLLFSGGLWEDLFQRVGLDLVQDGVAQRDTFYQQNLPHFVFS